MLINLIHFVCGILLAFVLVLSRSKEYYRTSSVGVHYVMATLYLLCVLWAVARVNDSYLVNKFNFDPFFLVWGFLFIYPLTGIIHKALNKKFQNKF